MRVGLCNGGQLEHGRREKEESGKSSVDSHVLIDERRVHLLLSPGKLVVKDANFLRARLNILHAVPVPWRLCLFSPPVEPPGWLRLCALCTRSWRTLRHGAIR